MLNFHCEAYEARVIGKSVVTSSHCLAALFKITCQIPRLLCRSLSTFQNILIGSSAFLGLLICTCSQHTLYINSNQIDSFIFDNQYAREHLHSISSLQMNYKMLPAIIETNTLYVYNIRYDDRIRIAYGIL